MLAISPVGRTKIYLRTGIQTNALMIRKRRAYDTSAGEEQFPVNAQGRAPNATRHYNGGAPLGARCTCANSWSPKGPLHTQKNNRCLCHVNSVQNYRERLLIAITEILRTFYYFGLIPNFECDKCLYTFTLYWQIYIMPVHTLEISKYIWWHVGTYTNLLAARNQNIF